jgi:hypothetical protein
MQQEMKEMQEKQESMMRINEKLMQLFDKQTVTRSNKHTIDDEQVLSQNFEMTVSEES